MKMKRYIILFAILIGLVLINISGCTRNNSLNKEKYMGSLADMSGYISIDDDRRFYKISTAELLSLFRRNESGVVMISKEDCVYCQNAMHILNDAAKDSDSYIYYVDCNDPMPESTEKEERKQVFEDLCVFIDQALKTDEKGEKSLYVPLLIKVKNGKMTDYHFSLVSSFSVDKSLKLNDTEEKELYEIYRRMIEE